MTRTDLHAPIPLAKDQPIQYRGPTGRRLVSATVVDGRVRYGQNKEARYQVRVDGKLKEIPAGWIRWRGKAPPTIDDVVAEVWTNCDHALEQMTVATTNPKD